MDLAWFDAGAGRVLVFVLGEPLPPDAPEPELLHALVMALEQAWVNDQLYAGTTPDPEEEGRAEAVVPAVCYEMDALLGRGRAVGAAELLVEQARLVLDVARRILDGELWAGVYDPSDAWLPGYDRR